jgi:PKD repeat protein
MKKTTMICVALAMMIVGCKRITVDFTYSPAEPKAGETIKFSNNSSAGENWTWTFGDNNVSRVKHPSKVFSKPGEYMVTLMVDSAKYKTCTKSVIVYDTIPTFVADTDTIAIYHDVELRANVYNPFGYTLTYQWTLPENAVLHSGELTDRTIVVYFTKKGTEQVGLKLTQKKVEYDITKELTIYDTKAPAMVMHLSDGKAMHQRIINDRMEDVQKATSADEQLIAASNDTVVNFNGVDFYASKMSELIAGFAGMQIDHIQLDAMKQKWYVSTPDGLLVANFDGSEQVVVDAAATGAVFVDAERNRLYWANTQGVWAMPLVKSRNNQFTTTPVQYNNLNNVDLITVNTTLQ